MSRSEGPDGVITLRSKYKQTKVNVRLLTSLESGEKLEKFHGHFADRNNTELSR